MKSMLNKEINTKEDAEFLISNINNKKYLLEHSEKKAIKFLKEGYKQLALMVMLQSSTSNSVEDIDNKFDSIDLKNMVKDSDFNLQEALKQLDDTVVHKHFVMDSAQKMARFFLNDNNFKMASDIMNRAYIHDNSKFLNEEFDALAKISNDMSCMQDAKQSLSKLKEEAIKIHWKNNKHHPEYWKNYNDMSDLDIIEMVCDWHSRSTQYKTDLLEFVKARQDDRFKFPEKMFEKILFYCNILLV